MNSPLLFQKSTTEPVAGVKPVQRLESAGRDIYIREGCYNCHSQMIRPFRSETERYGHYSVAGESVYDHPFQWAPSAPVRTWLVSAAAIPTNGTASAWSTRVMWCRVEHASFPWLAKNLADADGVARQDDRPAQGGCPVLRREIAEGKAMVEGKSEMEALIAYLRGLGLQTLKNALISSPWTASI